MKTAPELIKCGEEHNALSEDARLLLRKKGQGIVVLNKLRHAERNEGELSLATLAFDLPRAVGRVRPPSPPFLPTITINFLSLCSTA